MNATLARKDVHRPSIVDPAEYVEVGFADLHPEEGSSWMDPAFDASTAIDFDGHFQATGHCDHCGSGRQLRHVTFFQHRPTKEVIAVGNACATKLNLSSRSALERRELLAAQKRQETREGWEAAAPENREAAEHLRAWTEWPGVTYYLDDEGASPKPRAEVQAEREGGIRLAGFNLSRGLLSDLAHKLNRYGSLSPKQVALVLRVKADGVEAAAKLDARADEPVAAVVEGRQEIAGKVLSTKFVDSQFGGAMKMLVRDDRGFKVWGTMPAAIEVERGDRVTFTGTVEASDDDPSFGFFKRPTKAEAVGGVDEDEVEAERPAEAVELRYRADAIAAAADNAKIDEAVVVCGSSGCEDKATNEVAFTVDDGDPFLNRISAPGLYCAAHTEEVLAANDSLPKGRFAARPIELSTQPTNEREDS